VAGHSPDECDQVRVALIFEGRAHAVSRAVIDLERRVLDDLGRERGGSADQDDLFIIAIRNRTNAAFDKSI
jgi:hypothetical protein